MKKLLLSICFVAAVSCALAQNPSVTGISPASHSLTANPDTPVVVTFDQAMDESTVTDDSFMVFGRWSGPMTGTMSWSGGTELTFTPNSDYFHGEFVSVMLTKDVQAMSGEILTHGYQFGFWIKTLPGYMLLEEVEVIEMRTPEETFIQCYGAYAGDINNDEFSDLVVVNEFAEDIRILINDGTGHFGDWTQQLLPGSTKPSTNEGADFNHDGEIDLALGSTQGPEVSVLIGNGDGTFEPEVTYDSHDGVRGLAILDMDCDGWADIATANRDGNDVGFFINNQDGTFATPYFMETGSNKETAAMAADFNNDGIMDLAIGSYLGSDIMILTGDGEGNFTVTGISNVNSNPWMIGVGDVNGDGNCDVVSANAGNANMSVHFGNGAGGLGNPAYYPTGTFPLAIDLGDLDGDGDLDMISSNYSGKDFTLYENDGTGVFINPITYDADGAGSCAIFHDRDNDGVMDLTGIDEISDLVFLYENSTPTSLSTLSFRKEFRVYPNPSNGNVSLENFTGNDSQYVIRDMRGRLVLQGYIGAGQVLQLEIDVPAQVLLVEINEQGTIHRDRLIVR